MSKLDTNPNRSILVPYDDYAKLSSDSTRVQLSLDLLYASFPDDACRMTALKAALGYKEPETNAKPVDTETTTEGSNSEPTTNPDPADPSNP